MIGSRLARVRGALVNPAAPVLSNSIDLSLEGKRTLSRRRFPWPRLTPGRPAPTVVELHKPGPR